MLPWRSERGPPPAARSAGSIAICAVRRRKSPRTRTAPITPKASVAVAANTSTLSIAIGYSAGSAPSDPTKPSIVLDPEVHHAVHDEVADHHPRGGGAEAEL